MGSSITGSRIYFLFLHALNEIVQRLFLQASRTSGSNDSERRLAMHKATRIPGYLRIL